jgi:hypothetical protein
MLLNVMKLAFSILVKVLEIYVQNRGCSLPTSTLLKKPLFHRRAWGQKPSTDVRSSPHWLLLMRINKKAKYGLSHTTTDFREEWIPSTFPYLS